MTTISWTDETWNPTDGCEVCSPGCANCYAMRFAGRFSKPGERYHGLVTIAKNKRAIWTGEGRLDPGKLAKPLAWRKPRRVFVNSMSDLFFDRFTNEEIAAVFGVMAAAPQHTFQVLTKRARRMREWFEWIRIEADRARDSAVVHYEDTRDMEVRLCVAWLDTHHIERRHVAYPAWPLPNVWLGVSVENQDAADERIPELLRTPAAIRFLSCEPLLGELGIESAFTCPTCGYNGTDLRDGRARRDDHECRGIDWVISGCESGPGARPCDVAWLRSLRDQCAAAGVPYFLKQAKHAVDHPDATIGAVTLGEGSHVKGGDVFELPYLDGVQHAAFPEVAR